MSKLPPIFRNPNTYAVFAALKVDRWRARERIKIDDKVLLAWVEKGFVQRRRIKVDHWWSYEYRRLVPVPPAPQWTGKASQRRDKPRRSYLPAVEPVDWTPKHEWRMATDEDWADYLAAVSKIGSLEALALCLRR